MTSDDIIRLAREAGAGVAVTLSSPPGIASAEFRGASLERFAALVAAAEREECAKLCLAQRHDVRDCAAAIRARNNPPKQGGV